MSVGVFDSGVGGLTVFRALAENYPNADLYYVGDTARVPYGNKSPETIIRYSDELTNFLVNTFHVDAVVVACNTASSYSIEYLKEKFKIPVIGVVEPGASKALEKTVNGRIGIIGTQATINSCSYLNMLRLLSKNDVYVCQKSCPLLVPMVEEGRIEHPATLMILEEYLDELVKQRIDTLILGCTHYPLLKGLINRLYPNIVLVDSSEAIAEYLKGIKLNLQEKGIRNICTTDESSAFELLKKLLVGNIPTLKVNISSISET